MSVPLNVIKYRNPKCCNFSKKLIKGILSVRYVFIYQRVSKATSFCTCVESHQNVLEIFSEIFFSFKLQFLQIKFIPTFLLPGLCVN